MSNVKHLLVHHQDVAERYRLLLLEMRVQTAIGRYLVVVRTRGVQASRRLADQLEQARLDVHMNVFKLMSPLERLRLDLIPDRLQPAHYRAGVFSR